MTKLTAKTIDGWPLMEPLGKKESDLLKRNMVPHERVLLVFITNFAMGFAFGVALGLVEVSLAERLVTGAHGPGHDVRSEDADLPGGAAATQHPRAQGPEDPRT